MNPSSRITIVPSNEAAWHALRAADVTSTESSALFGMSPYATQFELWHRKHDKQTVQIEAEGRMLWGTRLQDVIARGVAEDYGVKVRRMTAYMRLPDARMGASFDFEIVGAGTLASNELESLYREHGVGNMEIKNVDALIFRDTWLKNDDGSIEAPEHIEIQVQHQLEVSGREWCALVALVGGNTPVVIVRMRDREVGSALRERVSLFWQSIADNIEPPPLWPDDAKFIASLYKYAEPDKVLDGRGNAELADLAKQYKEAGDREKLAKEDKDVAKAKLLQIIGDHERAVLDGFSVSAGMVGPASISYDREGYRNFRITPKKLAAQGGR